MNRRLVNLWKSLAPRKRKLIAWSVGLLLFYTIFGFLILPWIVKFVAVKQISKLLDRETSIRQVRINPYVLSGTIRGLLVKDKDGQPFLSFDEAFANFQLASFFGRPWVFKDVWTVKPYFRVQINPDYSFNFSDLTKKFSEPSATPKKPSKPLFVHIDKFQINGASASVTDLTPSKPFHRLIGPLQITLNQLHTDPNNQNPYSFEGTTESGEKFSWSGHFSLEPLQSAGELSLEGLSLPKYAPLIQDLVRFEVKDGVVDGRAEYRFALAGSNYLAAVTNAACSLKALRVTERGGTENLVELDGFAVTGVSADVAERRAEVGQVAVNGARMTGRRKADGTINLVQLAEPAPGSTNVPGGVLFLLKAATNAFAALVQSTNLWSATVHQADVTNCSAQWEDQAAPHPVRLSVDEIALSARHLSNVTGANQTALLSLRWNTNGTAQIGASVQLSPPAADVTMDITNVELSPLGPYAEQFANLLLIGGKIGVEGSLQMRTTTNELPEVSFRGDARLDDFAALDSQTTELLKWKSLQVNVVDANLQPPTVAVKEIAIADPSVRVALDTNQSLNFLTVLKTPDTNATITAVAMTSRMAERSPTGARLSLGQKLGRTLRQALSATTNNAGGSVLPKATVETISITNGFVQFDDRSVQPPVSSSLQELSGTIKGVSSEELKRADLHFVAKAARTGPIEITGKLNPLNPNAPAQLTVTFSNVDLSPASPYSGKFLGYRLNRGRLGLQADYEVTERKIKAKNVVVLDQLTLGEKVQSPDATKLPVKLGIALLKDRNGKIELELPIDGNLDDPNFHFGKVIVSVLVNVMTRIVTSPFTALGALFGGKGEEVSFQDFAPGSAQLQTAHAQELDALVNGLYERPGLELQIEGAFDPVTDSEGLRKLKLERKFREQKWTSMRKAEQARTSPDDIVLTPQEYASFLQAAYEAALKAGSLSNTVETAAGAPSRTPASAAPNTTTKSQDQRGATALLQKLVADAKTTADEKERLVLSTIQIANGDLAQLASERARNARQRILDSGKVDGSRLVLVDLAANPSTNHASRVYFHLQ